MTRPKKITYKPAWSQGSFAGYKAMEEAIVRKTNALRAKVGLPALTVDERLRVGARQHNQEMIKLGYYRHHSPVKVWRNPWQRACHAGYLDPYVSENIGLVSGYSDVPQAMVQSWRHSPKHYKNIIDKQITQIGVGVSSFMRSGGRIYYATQLFGRTSLDFRKLTLKSRRDRVLSLYVFLGIRGTAQVQVWNGRMFRERINPVLGKAVYTTDLVLPRRSDTTFSFALERANGQRPLVCAQVTVKRNTTVRIRRMSWVAQCRQITKVLTARWRYARTSWVLQGEAKAVQKEALKARYFLNSKWGPSVYTRLGSWVPFSRMLPTNDTLFSLVVGRHQKDYLRLAPNSSAPFRCP